MAAGLQGISYAAFLYCMVLSLYKFDFIGTGFHLISPDSDARSPFGTTHALFDDLKTSSPPVAKQLMRLEALSHFIIHPGDEIEEGNLIVSLFDSFKTGVCQHNLLFTMALLVCGDIHPCPGPCSPTPSSNHKDSGFNFLYMNARSLKSVSERRMCKVRDFEAISTVQPMALMTAFV